MATKQNNQDTPSYEPSGEDPTSIDSKFEDSTKDSTPSEITESASNDNVETSQGNITADSDTVTGKETSPKNDKKITKINKDDEEPKDTVKSKDTSQSGDVFMKETRTVESRDKATPYEERKMTQCPTEHNTERLLENKSSEKGAAPASKSTKESTALESESTEDKPAPESESIEENTAPNSESTEEKPAPERESTEENTAPTSESTEENTAPESEPTEENTAPGSESTKENTALESESTEESTAP